MTSAARTTARPWLTVTTGTGFTNARACRAGSAERTSCSKRWVPGSCTGARIANAEPQGRKDIMRQNPSFVLGDIPELRRLIENNPWVTLVSDTTDGLVASHYAVVLDPER